MLAGEPEERVARYRERAGEREEHAELNLLVQFALGTDDREAAVRP